MKPEISHPQSMGSRALEHQEHEPFACFKELLSNKRWPLDNHLEPSLRQKGRNMHNSSLWMHLMAAGDSTRGMLLAYTVGTICSWAGDLRLNWQNSFRWSLDSDRGTRRLFQATRHIFSTLRQKKQRQA